MKIDPITFKAIRIKKELLKMHSFLGRIRIKSRKRNQTVLLKKNKVDHFKTCSGSTHSKKKYSIWRKNYGPLRKSEFFTRSDGKSFMMIIEPLRLTPKQYLRLYKESYPFQRLIGNGPYVYCNGYMVLLSDECLSVLNGRYVLTRKFYKSWSDYCIYTEYEAEITGFGYGGTPVKHNSIKKNYIPAEKLVDTLLKGWGENAQRFNPYDIDGMGDEPNDFGLLLIWLMNRSDLTIEKLADMSQLSVRTISRMREYHGFGKTPQLNSIMKIIIGLSLEPYYGSRLIALAGYCIIRNSPLERAYQLLIGISYVKTFTVDAANAFLEDLRLPKL